MSKLTRIISQLQKAKEKGVKEIELLKDWETSGNARIIRHRINKILQDRNGIVTKDGVWYLDEDYWKMTKSEFKDFLWRSQISEMNFKLVLVSIVAMLMLVFSWVYGYQLWQPKNIYQCAEIFNVDLEGIE